MTNQEIFDKVATHLLTQKVKAKDEANDNYCRYRTATGLKCAVGCLIPDELYTPEIEGCSMMTLEEFNTHPVGAESKYIVLNAILKTVGVSKANLSLLIRLQDIHDFPGPSRWKDSLGSLATDFKLNKEVLNQFQTKE